MQNHVYDAHLCDTLNMSAYTLRIEISRAYYNIELSSRKLILHF